MFLTECQVAEQLQVKRCTVRNARLKGAISYVRVGCRFYYIQEHIDDYIREHTIHATPQPSARSASATAVRPLTKSGRAPSSGGGVSEMQKRLARERIAEILKQPLRKPR